MDVTIQKKSKKFFINFLLQFLLIFLSKSAIIYYKNKQILKVIVYSKSFCKPNVYRISILIYMKKSFQFVLFYLFQLLSKSFQFFKKIFFSLKFTLKIFVDSYKRGFRLTIFNSMIYQTNKECLYLLRASSQNSSDTDASWSSNAEGNRNRASSNTDASWSSNAEGSRNPASSDTDDKGSCNRTGSEISSEGSRFRRSNYTSSFWFERDQDSYTDNVLIPPDEFDDADNQTVDSHPGIYRGYVPETMRPLPKDQLIPLPFRLKPFDFYDQKKRTSDDDDLFFWSVADLGGFFLNSLNKLVAIGIYREESYLLASEANEFYLQQAEKTYTEFRVQNYDTKRAIAEAKRAFWTMAEDDARDWAKTKAENARRRLFDQIMLSKKHPITEQPVGQDEAWAVAGEIVTPEVCESLNKQLYTFALTDVHFQRHTNFIERSILARSFREAGYRNPDVQESIRRVHPETCHLYKTEEASLAADESEPWWRRIDYFNYHVTKPQAYDANQLNEVSAELQEKRPVPEPVLERFDGCYPSTIVSFQDLKPSCYPSNTFISLGIKTFSSPIVVNALKSAFEVEPNYYLPPDV
jgi:hypothetical protein